MNTNTSIRLPGPEVGDVIYEHGGKLQKGGIKNFFVEFDTLEAALACADELRTGGVRVLSVVEGDPRHSRPDCRKPVMTYRPD